MNRTTVDAANPLPVLFTLVQVVLIIFRLGRIFHHAGRDD